MLRSCKVSNKSSPRSLQRPHPLTIDHKHIYATAPLSMCVCFRPSIYIYTRNNALLNAFIIFICAQNTPKTTHEHTFNSYYYCQFFFFFFFVFLSPRFCGQLTSRHETEGSSRWDVVTWCHAGVQGCNLTAVHVLHNAPL